MSTKFAVQQYINEGWSPIPIPKNEKGPRLSGWESTDFTPADFADDDNIGVHLGKSVNGTPALYDVDLDDKMAAVAAEILLPHTNRVHGRPSKPKSHYFYFCPEQINHVSFHGLGGGSDTIAELRGISPTSGSYTQTVIPPSMHPSGEQLAWDQHGKVALLPDAKLLIDSVRDVCISVAIARVFPGQGNRHEPRLAMAGFLYRAGLDELVIKAIGRAVMRIVGGDENDWLDVCRTTIQKLKSDPDATVTGGRKLAELMGEDGSRTIKLINKWLGRQDQAAIDEIVERFNHRYFLVTAGTTACVADDSDPFGIKLFTHEMFKKKHIKEQTPAKDFKDKQGKTRTKPGEPAADLWLKHPEGRQFENLVYCPPPLVAGAKDYNGWKGFAVAPVEGPWPLLEAHIRDIVCGGDDEGYYWLMNWCAALVQSPGHHAITGVVLQGGQGVGKGLFVHDVIGKMFDMRHYICISSSEQFYGRFAGELLSGRVLCFLDEATWGGDKRDMGTLKDRVTGDYLLVDRKNISQVMERSMLHLMIASNEDWPIGIDGDDRRFTVFNVKNPRANDPSYFGPIYAALDAEQQGFLWTLMNFPVVEELLRKPYDTEAKQNLKDRSLAPEADWWLNKLVDGKVLVNDKTWVTAVVRSLLHTNYLDYMQSQGHSRRLSPQGLNKRLKVFCPSLSAVKPHGKSREWVVPSLDQARREFDSYLKMTRDWDAD